jgi:hypothetical protein
MLLGIISVATGSSGFGRWYFAPFVVIGLALPSVVLAAITFERRRYRPGPDEPGRAYRNNRVIARRARQSRRSGPSHG